MSMYLVFVGIMVSVVVVFFAISEVFSLAQIPLWVGVTFFASFWGLRSLYLDWCLEKRNVRDMSTNLLEDVETEWVFSGAFRRPSHLSVIRASRNPLKVVRGLKRLSTIQSELINRAEVGESVYDVETLRNRLDATQRYLEELRRELGD